MSHEIRIPISSDGDIVTARQQGRSLAATMGFSSSDATLIATAISELARNIVLYARHGEIILKNVEGHNRQGIIVVARDDGPGIANTRQALEEGFSSSGGLGLGLPGVRRLMDECDVVSEMGQGTTVTIKKWRRGDRVD